MFYNKREPWLDWEKENVNRNKMDCDRLGKKLSDKHIFAPVFHFFLFISLNDIGIVIAAPGIIGNLVMRPSSSAIARPSSLEFVFD